MADLLSNIKKFIEPLRGETIHLACSGGIDSMVLLHLLSLSHSKLKVLHVNYGLREKDSDLDEEFVRETCKNLKIPIKVLKSNLKQQLLMENGNLQNEARKERYNFFNEVVALEGGYIALAHQEDDQIETFFINLTRDAGFMGLSAMQKINGVFVRPLLGVSRKEIEEYARLNAIQWREDKSNSENKYQRNKWRNLFLPSLYKEIPELKSRVLTLIDQFQNEQHIIENKLKEYSNTILNKKELSFRDFDTLNDFEIIELLRQLALPFSLLEEIKKLRRSQKGKRISLNDSNIKEITNESDHFGFVYSNTNFTGLKLIVEELEKLPETFDKSAIYLDPEKIKGELKIRKWELGDRLKPIGINGSKLVSDILTDAKTPHSERRDQYVLCDDEKILWSIGNSISREAIASAGSKILKVSVCKMND